MWNHPLNATTQSNETTKSTWQRADVGFPSQPIAGVVQFRCRPPSRLRYKECRNVANNKHSSRPWTYTHTYTLKRDSKHITHRHYHLLFLLSLSLGLISDLQKHDSRGTLRLHREQVRFSFHFNFMSFFSWDMSVKIMRWTGMLAVLWPLTLHEPPKLMAEVSSDYSRSAEICSNAYLIWFKHLTLDIWDYNFKSCMCINQFWAFAQNIPVMLILGLDCAILCMHVAHPAGRLHVDSYVYL